MTQEQYNQLVIEYAEMKNVSREIAASVIINAVKTFVTNTKKEQQKRGN